MTRKLTTYEFEKRLEDNFGDQFKLLSEYINNSTKVKLLCKHCGNIIYKTPKKMTSKDKPEGCYICSGENWFKTRETLQKEVDERYPNTYIIIGEYEKARKPLEVKKITCGHVFLISPDNLLRGKSCPYCSIKQSSYMNLVENILDKYGIKYTKEKTFDDCRNIRPLPFDYYVDNLNILIEVDGEFHYEEKLSGRQSLEEVQKRDNIKTKYCKDNNIKLVRLPYYKKENFEEILIKELNLHVNTEVTNQN